MYLKDYVCKDITINNLYIYDDTLAKIVLRRLKKNKSSRFEYLKDIDETLAIKIIADIFWELEIGEYPNMRHAVSNWYDDELNELIYEKLEEDSLENEDCIYELSI